MGGGGGQRNKRSRKNNAELILLVWLEFILSDLRSSIQLEKTNLQSESYDSDNSFIYFLEI